MNPKSSPNPSSPNCSHIAQENLKAFVDSELSAFPLWRVQRHLSQCAACQKEVLWLKRIHQEMRDLKQETPRPELRARILANLPDAPPAPLSLPAVRRQGTPRLAYGAAFAMILVVGGAFALRGIVGTSNEQKQDTALHPLAPRQVAKQTDKTEENPVANSLPPADTDEINRKADELFRKEMQRLADKQKQQPQVAKKENATPLAPLLRLTPTETIPPSTPYREQVVALAQAYSGKVVNAPDSRGENMTRPGDARTLGFGTKSLKPNETMVVVQLPANQTDAFFKELGKMGTLAYLPEKPKTMQVLPHVPTEDTPPRPAQKAEKTEKLQLSPDNKGMVTLRIALPSAGSPKI